MPDDPIFKEFHSLIQRADSIGRVAVETIGFITPEELDTFLNGRDFKTLMREVVLKDWMAKYVYPYQSLVGCLPRNW